MSINTVLCEREKNNLQNDKHQIYFKRNSRRKKREIHTSTLYVKRQPSEQERSLNKSAKKTTILQTDVSSGSEQDRVDLSQQVNISHCEKQSS